MKAVNTSPCAIIVFGPTGVGKTSCVAALTELRSTEIINMDMGAFYTPLNIGTAKPDWRNSRVPHHLFDIIDTPTLYNVASYRKSVKKIAHAIWNRGNTPLLVGGSSFYLRSLFFPPSSPSSLPCNRVQTALTTQSLWKTLHSVDPVRAYQLHPHDTYRIERALTIWKTSGVKPSKYMPSYDPVFAHARFIYVTRQRQELYQRIDERVDQMIQRGWIDEAVKLFKQPSWRLFLLKKKIIGYDTLLSYFEQNDGKNTFKDVIASIKRRTRRYAKRQKTYWSMLRRQLESIPNKNVVSQIDITTMTDYEAAQSFFTAICIKT